MKLVNERLPLKEREHWHHLLDSSIWNDFMFRDDDIVINSYLESGTSWVQQIVAQLIWKGAEHINVFEVSPWLDCRFSSKEERLTIVEGQSHRRFMKSHVPVDTLVFSAKAKYIYIGRDGRDVIWSLHHHHRTMKQEVIEHIDSVPDRVGPPLGYAPSSILQYFRDWLTKDGYPWWPFWEHIRSWWQIRTLPNVMVLHFSNLKKDLAGEIQRIAAFLDIAVDEDEWNTILEHCSFAYMKAHALEIVPFGGNLWEGGAETFMNKGVNGRWKDVLPREDVERYEYLAGEKLGEECAYWLSTGLFQNIAKEAVNHE